MFILLIAATTALLILPFAPTAGLFLRNREALGPSPLSEGAYAPNHFARALITKLRARADSVVQPVTVMLECRLDGEPLLVLPPSMRRAPSDCTAKMSYALADLVLPPAMACGKEIATEGSLETGEGAQCRALYAADSLHINRNSRIVRWCHADSDLKVDAGCWILGRASANKMIKIDAPCTFVSMTAPVILLGYAKPPTGHPATEGGGAAEGADRVVRGPVSLAAGTVLRGSVKAYGRLCVGAHSVIEGALVCDGDILIGPGCRIGGPIVAEGDVYIAGGCEVGWPGHPASVVGEEVEISVPAAVCGAIHARRRGVIAETQNNIIECSDSGNDRPLPTPSTRH
ncbi:hypothetical protein [Acidiferrobacter sp.]|uniref:hypothetical protein n=1 Tax=Acidiferrobacter sp. TaxID=1872107 RepID=UPI00261491A0|nr:hypothetical protein [Acidiferrobacter sp.]